MTPKEINDSNLAAAIIRNLKKRRMDGFYCQDRYEAANKILEIMPKGSSVAWGGSETLTGSGILDAVCAAEYDIIDRQTAKTPAQQKEMAARISGADYFLISTNAITTDGVLVNTDGRGNRVSYLCYGPAHVIIAAGMNKVTTDLDSALKRVQLKAAPPNCVRLAKKTPCSVNGICNDCLSPDCICSQTVITRLSWVPGRITVVLIGEELGF